jgi:hypothetical protein
MTITISSYDNTYIFDTESDDLTVPQVLQECVKIMISTGYSEGSIKKYFDEHMSPLEWDTDLY